MTSPESLERAREWWDAHWSEHRDVGISLLAALLDTVRAEERAKCQEIADKVIRELVAAVSPAQPRNGWLVAWCECRVCPDGARHVSVFPTEANDKALECPRCHAKASEAVEYISRAIEPPEDAP